MDKREGVRHGHGAAAGATDHAPGQHNLPVSALTNGVHPTSATAATRRRGPGRDPDPTEEILAMARRARKTRGDRLNTKTMEVTHPVGTSDSVGTAEWHVAPADAHTLPVLVDIGTTVGQSPPATQELRLPRGTVLAKRYVVFDEAEDSGMGLVYRALDRQRKLAGSAEPWVALKIARTTGAAGTSANLRQEFLKLSALRHPHIVAVYDLGSDNDTDFMVLEWLRGETLADLLARINSRRIALRAAQDIITSVAEALAHAHAAGIVHGDIKPSNIFLTRDRGVKLLDFGASAQSSPGSGDPDERSWATRAYASCDVLSGLPPRPCDDVFALGVTAYLLLSGARPFGELDAVAAKEQGVSPPALPEDASEFWPAIRSALQFDAVNRPSDAAEFLQRLSDAHEEPQSAAEFPRPVPTQVMAIAWGALAALVLAVTVWWSVPDVATAPTKVERLLGDAAGSERAGRLIAPPGNNAAAQYSAVLTQQPDNAEAQAGLDRIAEAFLTRARMALNAEDLDAAVQNLQTARIVRPDHFGIAAIEDLITRFRRDLLVRAREAAENDLGLADEYLARAAALSPADDPDVERVRAEVQEMHVAAELESLMRGIDERILAERLTVPAGDSAVDLLQRATRLAPGNREVQLAQDRIVSALLFQAMFSISNGGLDDAERYIDAAKSLRVRHLALARAEYELAKARNESLTTRENST